jgi:hypothetical protein
LIAQPVPDRSRLPWLKRIGWLVLIWAASVAAVALIALLLKLLMRGSGLIP